MTMTLDINLVPKSASKVADLDTGGKKHPFAVTFDGEVIQVFTFQDGALHVATALSNSDFVDGGDTSALKWGTKDHPSRKIDSDTSYTDSPKSSATFYSSKKLAAVSSAGRNYLFFVNDDDSCLMAMVFDPSSNGAPVGWCRLTDGSGSLVTVKCDGVSACRYGSMSGILLTYLKKQQGALPHIAHLALDLGTLDLENKQWAGDAHEILMDDSVVSGIKAFKNASFDQLYVQAMTAIKAPSSPPPGSPVQIRAYGLLGISDPDNDDQAEIAVVTSWDLGSAPRGDWPVFTARGRLTMTYNTGSGAKTTPRSADVLTLRGGRLAADPAGRVILLCNDVGATGTDQERLGMRLFAMQEDGTLQGSNPLTRVTSRSDPSVLFTITDTSTPKIPVPGDQWTENVRMCLFFSVYDDTTNIGAVLADYGKVNLSSSLDAPNDRTVNHLTMIADALPSPTPGQPPPGLDIRWGNESPSGTVGYDIYGYSIKNTDESNSTVEMEFNKAFGFTAQANWMGQAWDMEFARTVGKFSKIMSSTYSSSTYTVQTKGQYNPFAPANPGDQMTYLVMPASQVFVRPLPSMNVLQATFDSLPVYAPAQGVVSTLCAPSYGSGNAVVAQDFFTYAQDPNDMASYTPAAISKQMSQLYQSYKTQYGAAATDTLFGADAKYFVDDTSYFSQVIQDFAVPIDGSAPKRGADPVNDYPLTIALDGGGQSFQSSGSTIRVEQGTTLETYLKEYFGIAVSFDFLITQSASLMWGFQFTSRQSKSTSSAKSFTFDPTITQNPLSGGEQLVIRIYRLKPASLWGKEINAFPDIAKKMYITKYGGDPNDPKFNTFSYNLYKTTTDYDAAQPQRILVTASFSRAYTPAS